MIRTSRRRSGAPSGRFAVQPFPALLPTEIEPAGDGWAGCTMARFEAVRIDCPLGPLAARSSRTLTVDVVAAGRPRLTGRDEPGQYQPSNHYLSIGQQAPYALEVAQDHEADIRITAL